MQHHPPSIIALSTPSGKGALALLRLSGSEAVAIAQKMARFDSAKNLLEQKSHTIHYGQIVNRQLEPLDRVLFLLMRAPHTFTGEDTVEITCHNNPFIIESIIQEALYHGARQAQPGEFTRRAFENNKLDLTQAEAINELLCAQTQTALKKSLAQLEGTLSHWIQELEQKLLKALAWSEASFEFLEDEGDFAPAIKNQLETLLESIKKTQKSFNVHQQIREGFRIALIGSVNAGKSSLFNYLLQQERSIVTNIAGTTRDSVEAGLYRNGNHWTLIDTAGLRQTEDIVEQAGIKRSREEAHKADIILLIIDGSRTLTPEEAALYEELRMQYANKIIIVITKSDLIAEKNHFCPLTPAYAKATDGQAELVSTASGEVLTKPEGYAPHDVLVSTVTGHGCSRLEEIIEQKIAKLLEQSDAPFLLNTRQFNLLVHLERVLQDILPMLIGSQVHYELVSYRLREALEDISELTGKSITEAAMDMVFKEFCVGK